MVHQMIPFYVEFKPGAPIYEQVVYAATKSIISGQLRPGDEFPSVRHKDHLKCGNRLTADRLFRIQA